jgi:hypothetical protein
MHQQNKAGSILHEQDCRYVQALLQWLLGLEIVRTAGDRWHWRSLMQGLGSTPELKLEHGTVPGQFSGEGEWYNGNTRILSVEQVPCPPACPQRVGVPSYQQLIRMLICPALPTTTSRTPQIHHRPIHTIHLPLTYHSQRCAPRLFSVSPELQHLICLPCDTIHHEGRGKCSLLA